MCKKLYELSGLTAAEILTLCGEKSYPVNIENILAKLGVKYGPLDFTDTERKFPDVVRRRGEILGAVTLIGDNVNIFYRQGCSENRKRFTLAHELAHCCLDAVSLNDRSHVEFRLDRESENLKEQAANVFAGELLIPETSLRKLYNNIFSL